MDISQDKLLQLFEDIGGIKSTLENFREESKNQATRTDLDRAEFRNDIAALRVQATETAERIEGLETDTAAIKPFIEKAKAWENRGIGAAMVLSALGAIFGGTAVAFRDKILATLGIT